MIQWLKKLLAYKNFLSNDSIYEYAPAKDKIEEVKPKKKNFSALQQCSMTPHSKDCNVLDCTGSCWKFIPDKIVHEEQTSWDKVKQERIRKREMRRKNDNT